ncbi:GGDEF domain-containing protein [Coralliovum pocilloporae]|uniref:GGDEF domain-containing protein n=1 Tax=Coralliovum pocilloporae TaxID=3066369 RepID=UPI003307316A
MGGKGENFERTYSYGTSALGHIKKSEVPAYPRNYELFYTYAVGFNHTLNKAINEILRARGRLSMEEVESIYDEFLSPNRLGDRIEEVGGKLTDEIGDVLEMLVKSQGSTSEYGESLAVAATELATSKSSSEATKVIKNLITATKGIIDNNNKLHVQLTEAQGQISDLQENLETIMFESLTDELTTLANRKHFDQSMERALTDAEQSGKPLTLLVTDIDHFKKFNDTYGHQTGDQVLRLVALSVKQNVKGQDIPCRYGGEEFTVILPDTSMEQAEVVAENIRAAVQGKELVKRSTGENLGRVTISIGISQFRTGDNPSTMIERADACLYAAKENGRNVVITETDDRVNFDKYVA